MKSALRQLWFAFSDAVAPAPPAASRRSAPESTDRNSHPAGTERDRALEEIARALLLTLGLQDAAGSLCVVWNPRLRSTAGYAKWPEWLVELNPRLKEFEGQTEHTLKHELAHLVAYARAGRRRIEPHGPEWRKACADLGIPHERASHTMPLPRHRQRRKFSYVCPGCGTTSERVRKFRRHTACLACCKKHNRGHYDPRFQFVLKKS